MINPNLTLNQVLMHYYWVEFKSPEDMYKLESVIKDQGLLFVYSPPGEEIRWFILCRTKQDEERLVEWSQHLGVNVVRTSGGENNERNNNQV